MRHQITEPLPNLSEVRPDIPKHVPESLGRALRPDPTQRFPTVLDFVAALGGTPSLRVPLFAPLPRHGPGAPVIFMDDEPERRPTRRILAVVAGGVIALGVGAAWLAEGRPRCHDRRDRDVVVGAIRAIGRQRPCQHLRVGGVEEGVRLRTRRVRGRGSGIRGR